MTFGQRFPKVYLSQQIFSNLLTVTWCRKASLGHPYADVPGVSAPGDGWHHGDGSILVMVPHRSTIRIQCVCV